MNPAFRSNRTLHVVLAAVVALAPIGDRAEADERRMEEIALAWVDAHNSGDVEKMAVFRAAHREDADNAWRQQFPGLVERLGHLEPTDVMISGPRELILDIDSAGRGRLQFTFQFSADDPERIRSIMVDQSGGGRDNDLPVLTLDSDDWSEKAAAIDAYIVALADEGRFSGAVLISQDDEVHFDRAYGLASREFDIANTLDTRFDIGSITKDFTRVAIAQLIAAGKLGMDDKLGQHLPDYPNPEAREKVTVRHLFEHSSGVGDYFTDEWVGTPMGALRDHWDYIDIWGPKPLEFEPGSDQRYSNFGFTILGAIIDRVSGQPYFDYIAEHVFAPAGMTATGFFATDLPEPDVAVGYTFMIRGGQRGDTLRKNIYLEPVVGGPWGKTYSTARDLWQFWQALSHHQLTAPAYTSWVLLSGPPPSDAEAVGEADPVTEIGLGGGGPGLSAELLASRGRVIIVLANLDPPITTYLAGRLGEALGPAR